ncbi:ABC transporter permease [Chloroflexi bacterium TSY]|nr:ABC transporter permease [Chloroflexi bacterium TSY]
MRSSFFNGTFVTVERLPAWLEAVAKLLPTTQGIIVLRRIVLGGDSLGAVWRDGSLIWLIIHSLICFVIGWLIFVRLETKAKRQGLLGHY